MNAAGKALSFAAKALYYGAVALSFLFVMAPSVLMMIVAFNDADYFSFPLKGVSLNWFAEMLENDNYRGSVVNSLKLAVYATALSVLMTMPASLWLYRRTNRFVETVLLAPLFFPLVIWSLGLLQLYGMLGLSGRFITLVLAHAVMVTPFILRVVLQSLREMNRRLEEAAYSLGAGRWSTFRRVILPIIMPGVFGRRGVRVSHFVYRRDADHVHLQFGIDHFPGSRLLRAAQRGAEHGGARLVGRHHIRHLPHFAARREICQMVAILLILLIL